HLFVDLYFRSGPCLAWGRAGQLPQVRGKGFGRGAARLTFRSAKAKLCPSMPALASPGAHANEVLMLKLSRSVILLFAAAAVAPLAGCAHGGKKADTAYVARDVSSLYTAAKRTMDSGDYEQSAKLFDEVERQHPYSVWARRAQLMSAFNYYLARKYTDAINSAQRFVTIHPGNAEAPYAQYLIGMSYYQQIDDVTRDQTTPQQASDAFGELIRRYPEN